MQKRLAILVGGYPLTPKEMSQIGELKDAGGYCVAVDGGLNAFHSLKLVPDIVLGDMDSCDLDSYQWYALQSKKQLFFPCDKDYLDMEAAIDFVRDLGFYEVCLFGVLGGRMDQTFSCLPFLIRGMTFGLRMTIISENCRMGVFKGPSENFLRTNPGSRWSFLAISKVVEGFTLKGFKYNLEKGRLLRMQTIALSNVAVSSMITININEGIIIYFNQPGRQDNVEH